MGDLLLREESIGRIEHPSSEIWIDRQSKGHYQDMGSGEESELLEELKLHPWKEVVAKRYEYSRPWLYSIITDPSRAEFLKVLNLRAGGSFLDVGSGWGQVALPLSRLGSVYCLDLTMARLSILKEIARQERASLNYLLGNFLTFPFSDEQFDLIVFNGVLEYMAEGTTGHTIREMQEEALRKARSLLRAYGRLYIGIENSIGLKYLLGAPDDHTGIEHLTYLGEESANSKFKKSHPERDLRIKTWSLLEYREMLSRAQLNVEEVYCCFPDYKLIRAMVPINEVNDAILNSKVEIREHSGVDGSPLPQNEMIGAIYRIFAKNRIVEHVVPSFGIVASGS